MSDSFAETAGDALTASTALSTFTASQRIEFSRARLRAAMSPPAASVIGSGPQQTSWLQRVKQLPIVSLLVESFDAWWSNHPLHAAGQVAAEASSAVVRPVARRHPWVLVLVAASVGALLAWSRPWRWALRPSLLAGLAPQFASRVVANLPIESWMTLLGAALSQPAAGSASSASSGAPRKTSFEPSTATPMNA